jgi:predicted CopG family antitoxin
VIKMAEQTTIMINKEVRDQLKKYGYKDETYNQILLRLIEMAKKEMFFERQKRILETEEFVGLEKV